MSHYTPSEEWAGNVTFSIAQDDKGVIYFANNNGVLEFDGRNWGLASTPGPTFTVVSNGDKVFAGGFKSFGKITLGPENVRIFQSLPQETVHADQILSGVALKDKIFFCNHQTIFQYSIETEKIEKTIPVTDQQTEWNGLFLIANEVYARSSSAFYKIEDSKVVLSTLPIPIGESVQLAASLRDKTAIITTGSRLYVKQQNDFKEIVLKDYLNIQQHVPTSVAWMNESTIAIGTLRNGVYFIDATTGATLETTNFYTGLPDNEIYAMLADGHQGLWVAHAFGFTRIAPFLPFRSFSHYAGLAGNLLCVKNFQGVTYVGTTLGLYALMPREVEQIITQNVDEKGAQISKPGGAGLFSFLRKKRANQISSQGSSDQKAKTKVVKLNSFGFKKVEGIESKVIQMIESNGQLLAAGTFGIASIKDAKAKLLWNSPIRNLFMSPSLGQLLVSTVDDEIKTFSLGQVLNETHLLDTLTAYVNYIFEDKLQNIWLCGRTVITKVETVDGAISSVEEIPFVNPTIEESVGLAYGNEVYVAADGNFNRFNVQKNAFEKYDSFPGPKKYFASAGYFWFHDGHRWRTVDPRMQAALKLEWLSLFQNLRYIAPADKSDELWIITANNELYKFSPKTATTGNVSYPLFLKEVRGRQNKFPPARTVRISQLENTVQFEFVQPDYLGMHAIEYRYLIKGLSKNWTSWSSDNNIVNFSFLPAGNYKLEIQTRDLMGKVSKVEQIELEVEPPYWKRWWFYLLEMVFFGTLVFLSIRLSDGNPKYRLVSQVLSLLTVIMLIQLVQTIVASFITLKATPVLDFFMQVAIALMVLPLENLLRKFIVREGVKSAPYNLVEEIPKPVSEG